jgi:hypothetical protein
LNICANTLVKGVQGRAGQRFPGPAPLGTRRYLSTVNSVTINVPDEIAVVFKEWQYGRQSV